ncbi:galactosylgalactosylxylosylprotein 3-beta-glucuronosyltransferase P isoform X2 [Cephus cinctus]|uniref:Galactosylgalactosylxylosylprotein 3-beta-glucuronosyltransferase n=1 Tax=Cephus cinctus TaxID=211228 RepID=A0AAJ7C0Z7_CEPCN|nr:galactosylgalactosylxylosylprotein 3-beta-glucuronosyltransferase P isoform X2 [Cephus cinctus]
MRPSMKMGLIALLGVCVIFYQYHLSTGIRLDQIPNFNEAVAVEGAENLSVVNEIRGAVHAVQQGYGLSPDLGNVLSQEILARLKRNDVNLVQEEILINDPRGVRSASTASSSANSNAAICGTGGKTESDNEKLNPLFIITPTYRRPEQIPELTRMSHTLMLVRNVHWLVIEDALVPTKQVTELLKRTKLKFEHLIAPMPDKYKLKTGAKPRGVSNRNRGLQWLRSNATNGVFYFADDDNTYDIALFDEIRKTKKVSMFPVGLCTKYGLSSPIVKNGKFTGFYDGWIAGRKFPVDMAGFAVNVKFLLERPSATMPFRAGFEEDGFLRSLAPFEPRDIELLADNCTRILAWHTQTKKNEPSAPLDMKLYGLTNLVLLKKQIV